jgi:hypothetical protein
MRAALSMLLAALAGLMVPGPAAAHPPPMVPRERIPAHLPPEIRRHIERLYSPNDADCTAAARALGDLGDAAAVEPLLGALQDPDWHLRWVAAQGLGRLKDGRAAEPLAAALKDRHWYVRRAAAEALGALADRPALLALIGALEDEHWYVRASAVAALRTATGQDLAPDPKAWRTWLAKNGAG